MVITIAMADILSPEDQNPWWRDPGALDNDAKLRDLGSANLRWSPSLRTEIDLERDRIYTLRGMRQVGKTTLVKSMMRDLMEGGVDPRCLLYYSCEMLHRPRELIEVLTRFRDLPGRPEKHGRLYAFIDEVTSVRGWERAVKHLADMGSLEGMTVVLTGSHSLDLKYAIERLPGRRGEGGGGTLNKVMRPMGFREYIALTAPQVAAPIERSIESASMDRHAMLLGMFDGSIHPVIEGELALYSRELRALLEGYLLTGGLVRAIREHRATGSVDPQTYEMYVRAVVGDLARWRFQEGQARQLLRSVVKRMGTRVSLNAIAKETEVPSHETVARYLGAFVDSYVLHSFHQLDLSDGQTAYKRERKLYFQDPFVYHAIRAWTRGSTDYHEVASEAVGDRDLRGPMVEMVVAAHVVRLVEALRPSDVLSPQEAVLYWRKKGTDREVDFVMRHRGEMLPMEVKYQPVIRSGDLDPLYTFRRGLLLSAGHLEARGSYSIVPVELFLMLV